MVLEKHDGRRFENKARLGGGGGGGGVWWWWRARERGEKKNVWEVNSGEKEPAATHKNRRASGRVFGCAFKRTTTTHVLFGFEIITSFLIVLFIPFDE